MKLIILIIGLIYVTIAQEDRGIYKLCEDSSFCRRARKVSGTSKYEVLPETLFTESTSVTVEIKNTENDHLFLLKLSALEDNTFHFEIDEKTPLKPRYRVKEVLQKTPSYLTVDVTKSTDSITVWSKLNKAVILLKPFQLEFYLDGVKVVSANSNGLMKFEELRKKPATPDPTEEEGTWEEEFNGGIDSKPNGPELVALDFRFPESDVLFGIPEHADDFALKVTKDKEPYRLYTLDVPGYPIDNREGLYGAVPVIYGHGPKNTAGIFWHNSADTFVDIHDMKNVHFISEVGIIDVFVFLGPKPHDTFKQYTKLTGVANLPQLFSLAYHQSRWNYMTQQDLLEVVSNFTKNELPMDTIWLDIEYTNGKRYFTWNFDTFPQPVEMMKNLSDSGKRLTYIIDPHIAKDETYFFYTGNKERGFYVKDASGNDYEGSCWPGMSSYVDFFNPEARRYYADQYLLENFKDNSIETGIWNDMNEPAVFDVPEKTMPRDNIHYGGWENRAVHNLYAFMQVKGTHDGLMRRSNGSLRPFILTRAFFAGAQRYTAMWTGDNVADWSHLQASIKICLSVSVSGISFCGSDVGGFIGHPEDELFVRWYQTAAYQPFFRSHAALDTPRREPYLLPEESLNIVRDAIRRRYALLPLWYTMFFEHERTGSPVMRPLLSEFPMDTNAFKIDNQFMLADKYLVRPVDSKGSTEVKVYFPSTDGGSGSEIWYDADDYTVFDTVGEKSIKVDMNKIPVYQRGGTIVPKKETVRLSSALMTDDPYTLIVALDKDQHAHGTLYIDDEKSFDYRRGKYLYINFEFHDGKLTNHFVDPANFTTRSKIEKIVIAGLKFKAEKAELEDFDGKTTNLQIESDSELAFTIKTNDLTLMYEWTITVSGAIQNLICGSLLIFVLIVHAVKNIFN